MGDGTRDRSTGMVLCTDSYSIPDVVKLMNVLIIRYGLVCTFRLHGGNTRIYIRKQSLPALCALVNPYMHSSMLYKLRD